MTNYKVQRLDGFIYEKCEKHVLKLWNMDNRKEVTTQRLALSDWQLEDISSYKSRIQDWANNNIVENIDKNNIEVDVQSPSVAE